MTNLVLERDAPLKIYQIQIVYQMVIGMAIIKMFMKIMFADMDIFILKEAIKNGSSHLPPPLSWSQYPRKCTRKRLFAGTVPSNKNLFAGTVPAN